MLLKPAQQGRQPRHPLSNSLALSQVNHTNLLKFYFYISDIPILILGLQVDAVTCYLTYYVKKHTGKANGRLS